MGLCQAKNENNVVILYCEFSQLHITTGESQNIFLTLCISICLRKQLLKIQL